MTSPVTVDIHLLSDQAIQDLLKEKQSAPDLQISYTFLEYYNDNDMLALTTSVHNYASLLIEINSTYISLKNQGKAVQAEKYSKKQSSNLSQAGQQVAEKYGKVLLKYKNLVSSLEDQSFFETAISFTIRVVKSCFALNHRRMLDEELNRLFRSTAFNIVQRHNKDSDRALKISKLKISSKRDPDSVIKAILVRSWASKSDHKAHSVECIKRPAFSKISPYRAIVSRSPLISMLLPTPRDKIREFEDKRRRMISKSPRLPQLLI